MPDSKKKKVKRSDVVNLSVRFDPDLYDKLEKYLGSIRRDLRPSKDQAVQDVVDATCRDDNAKPVTVRIGDPVMAFVCLRGNRAFIAQYNRQIRHQIEFEVWEQSPICR